MDEKVGVVTEEVAVETEDDGIVLPSDAEEQAPKKSYEELESEHKALLEKNAKAEDIAKRLKDEKSQSNRELSKSEEEAKINSERTQFSTDALTKAIESGGQFDEEVLAQATELGIDHRDLKLQLYEAEKNINNLYEKAGGKDAYFDMVEAVKEHVDENEVAKFKAALSHPDYQDLALYALKHKYNELSSGNRSTDNRITPKATVSNTSGVYNTEAEYFKDKRVANKLTGSDRTAMMNKISQKLAKSKIGL